MSLHSDMFNRMTSACHKKCIPPKYRDADLSKGEAVCIDRCVAKYQDIHERIGKKLTTVGTRRPSRRCKNSRLQPMVSLVRSYADHR